MNEREAAKEKMMKPVALVILAIGNKPHRVTHTNRHFSSTYPYLKHLAGRLGGDLIVFTEPQREGRQLPNWQKLCIPRYLSEEYEIILYMDFDILPHPQTPLDQLLDVPQGKIAMSPISSRPKAAQDYYMKALDLAPLDVSNVQHILNAGVFAWRTQGDEPIRALFDDLFAHAKEHCGEQTSFAHAIQQQNLHHPLPVIYNTPFVRAKPFPFHWHRSNKIMMDMPALWPIQAITDTIALRKLFKTPCFIHFVGGIYADALARGVHLLIETSDRSRTNSR